jgi:hypothetical protein
MEKWIEIKSQCDSLESLLNALPENQGVFESKIGPLLGSLRKMSILITEELAKQDIIMAGDDRTERQRVIDELINELDPAQETIINFLKRKRG